MSRAPLALQIIPGILMSAVLLVLAALSVGCATTAGTQELTWQALNVVDAGQTITVARNPAAFMEVDPLARDVIGAHPSEKNVYLFMIAGAAVHYGVTCALQTLDEEHPGHGWSAALSIWESASLGVKGFYIAKNNHYGIKPWGSADHVVNRN